MKADWEDNGWVKNLSIYSEIYPNWFVYKNHLYVNYSEIDDEEYGVSEEDKKINRKFYEK